MTRRKVKLQYIANDSQRKISFRKRKKGIVKKATELTTLCGVEACAVIYSPYDAQPEVWPSPAVAQRLLSRCKNLPDMHQTKNMMDQESFLKQRRDKLNKKLKKQSGVNRDKEMAHVMNQAIAGNLSLLQDLTMSDRNHLVWVIDQSLMSLTRRVDDELINGLQNYPLGVASLSMAAPPPPNAAAASVEMQQPQWFTDMMFCYDNNLPPFGDGNPTNSNFNQQFP